MNNQDQKQFNIKQAAQRALAEAEERKKQAPDLVLPLEINGCKGKEPTRFSDWERKGIAYDF